MMSCSERGRCSSRLSSGSLENTQNRLRSWSRESRGPLGARGPNSEYNIKGQARYLGSLQRGPYCGLKNPEIPDRFANRNRIDFSKMEKMHFLVF